MKEHNLKKNKSSPIKKILTNNGFRNLWYAQIFSQLADKFFIVLAVYLISNNWSNNILIGSVKEAKIITLLATGIYIANSIPAILFGAFAGIASDRLSKVKVMILSNSLRGGFALLIPLCLIKFKVLYGLPSGYWLLIFITFINSFLTQFFTPAEQSSIPLVLGKENLMAANSLYQATTMGATIFGFALGEPLIRGIRFIFEKSSMNGGEFILLPLCYLGASIALININIIEENKVKRKQTIWKDIKSSIDILKRIKIVRKAIIQLITIYSLMAALYALTITLAASIPELGPTKFGVLLGISGFGIAAGAFFLAQKDHLTSKRKLSAIGFMLITLSLLLIGQVQGLLMPVLCCCFLLGIGAAFVAIPAQTIVQEKTPEHELGKVFGLQNNLINISLSIPLVFAGVLVSQFGIIPVLWCLAALTLFGAISKNP